MIVACQVMDPGSIPGERIFALGLNHTCVRKVFCCPGCHYRQDIGILFCSFSTPIPETFIKGRIPHCRPPPSPGMEQQRKKSYPGNRSRTSDLEISIVAIYSLPLCQLSYTRTYTLTAVHSEQEPLLGSQGASKKVGPLRTVGIEPTLLRTRALSVRLNRSAKSAIVQKMASHNVHVVARKTDMTSWRNGNASDSRPEDWGFDSL
jgi:hypothetical protein